MTMVQLGLRQNARQFWLLVLINALVGGMVGLERTILPGMAKDVFGMSSHAAIFSFIVFFGLAKSVSNYFAGALADRFGRKNLLLAGWAAGLAVPFLLLSAQSWSWIIVANILLGINQGLAWSTTVVMKIDLAGERQRGMAMGWNEFAGYVAVAISAYATSFIAERYGVRPYPFYLGIGFSVLGTLLSWLFVRDTIHHATLEARNAKQLPLKKIFWQTTWKHRNVGAVTQAGFVNNLNDAMVWGLLPLVLAARGYSLKETGLVTALYPAAWGLAQLFTGKLSDLICKKKLLFWGMTVQGLALLLFLFTRTVWESAAVAVVLGLGTALVYPTFLASVAENIHPLQRAHAVGIFRFWRDAGYVAGALLIGLLSDLSGSSAAIVFVGLLTLASGGIIRLRMYCPERKVNRNLAKQAACF